MNARWPAGMVVILVLFLIPIVKASADSAPGCGQNGTVGSGANLGGFESSATISDCPGDTEPETASAPGPPTPTCDRAVDVNCKNGYDDVCHWEDATSQPRSEADVRHNQASYGVEPSDGTLSDGTIFQIRTCESGGAQDGSPAPARYAQRAAAVPPPDPAELALKAFKLLKLPEVDPQLGPFPEDAVVHLPLWLSVNNPGTLNSHLELRGVRVDLAATITAVHWSLGEPIERPGSGTSDIATVDCAGPGESAPAANQLPTDPAEWHPACGYSFKWRSDKGRTANGRWPIQATVEWTAVWTSNVGAGDQITTKRTGNTSIEVLELRTRLVDNPNSTPTPTPGG